MDGREEHHALSDEALATELEKALRVEPSPQFGARLRARVEGERDREMLVPSTPWRWAAVIAAMAVIAIAGVSLSRREAPVTPVARIESAVPLPPPKTSQPSTPSRELPPAVARAARGGAPHRAVRPTARAVARRAAPEVLISREEAAALRQLFAAIGERRFETAELPNLDASLQPPAPIAAIEIEPIAFAALDSE